MASYRWPNRAGLSVPVLFGCLILCLLLLGLRSPAFVAAQIRRVSALKTMMRAEMLPCTHMEDRNDFSAWAGGNENLTVRLMRSCKAPNGWIVAMLQDSNQAHLLLMRGEAEYLAGQESKAIATWRYAGAVPYFTRRGVESLENSLWDDAIYWFSISLDVDQQQDDIWFLRAKARRSAGDTNGAIADAIEAIRINPELEDAYVFLGQIYMQTGAVKAAEDWFFSAWDKFNDAKTATYLADYLLKQGDERAEGIIRQGLALSPEHVTLNYQMAILLHGRGEVQEAIAYLNLAVTRLRNAHRDEDDVYLAYMTRLSEWQLSVGDEMAALENACLVLRAQPENGVAAGILYKLGQTCP